MISPTRGPVQRTGHYSPAARAALHPGPVRGYCLVMPETFPTQSEIPPRVVQKLEELSAQHDDLARSLEDPATLADHRAVRNISIKKAALDRMVDDYRRFKRLSVEAGELEATLRGADAELAELAREELPGVRSEAAGLIGQILSRLVQADDGKVGSVMMEIRAGTGGDEAALWARDLLDMYGKYAARRDWDFEMLDLTPESDAGGVRSAVINVRGEGVWSELAFEAGVHSVKRVPATEAQGRIHTSTATVAVLPEPEDVDVKIDWANDVEEHVTTSQGPGGQNVNKVATAVQLHHKPSGIVIRMQESKSQQQNREKARRLLMTKLYDMEQQRKHAERSAARKSQIGSGDRSEKIRTYRYKDGIVADERLPGEYKLRDIVAGDLQELFRDLTRQETAKRLAEL